MTHDVVIRNGLIVDGLMNSAYPGDVAIDGDTISALGKVDTKGRREINAEGAVVTPGFIDLHTHMDAQIGWDPRLRPHHGTVSPILRKLRRFFAPVRTEDKELLAEMMESVEDIQACHLSGFPGNGRRSASI